MATVFNARATQPFEEYGKQIESAQNLTAGNDGLMGDSVSLYNGATEFTTTDINVPGNNALPVQLRRRFSVELKTGLGASNYGGIGNWDIDVPYINATWAMGAWPSTRCSVPSTPTVPAPLALSDVWHGSSVHIPGGGDRKLLTIPTATNFPKPTTGAFHWTTAQRDMVSCVTMQSGLTGEGFLLQTTDGLKYSFNVATTRTLEGIQYQQNGITTNAGRTQYYLLASKIEDRFGNSVTFAYNANGYPDTITSSDGRKINLYYNAAGTRLDHASVNVGTTTTVRTWYYTYGTIGDNANMLTTVTLPDTHTWQYGHVGSLFPLDEMWDGNTGSNCNQKPPPATAGLTFTVTHPSGAQGQFVFGTWRHPRSGIHMDMCSQRSLGGQNFYKLMRPNYSDSMTLSSKTITGPGLATLQWTYDFPYGSEPLWGTRGDGQPYPCTTCPSEKVVTVHEPDGTKTDYTYGYLYASNEGRLLKTTTYDQNAVVKRIETTTYLSEANAAGQNFYTIYGYGLGDDEPSTLNVRPIVSRTIDQDGVTFSWSVPTGCTTGAKYCFDAYGNPTKVVRSSTLGYSRTEQISYVADTDPLVNTYWLLGLVTQTKCIAPTAALPVGCGASGTVMSETTYHAQYGVPLTTKSFGKLQQTLTYTFITGTQDGTLSTVKDGNNHITTLSSWYRGVPRLITYPATDDQPTPVTMQALVDDNGWITSVVDENGYSTGYGYDYMGRLEAIVYPQEDNGASGTYKKWNDTTITYQQIATSEYGIPGGHWKRTESTGNGRKITYYDGMWRPLVEEQYDAADATNTRSLTVKRYDLAGQLAFQSYPLASLTTGYADTNLKGTATTYDALDRVLQVAQDWEGTGKLTTTTAYLTGFKTKVTNPRTYSTITGFMAFDQPTYDWPVDIDQADGQAEEADVDIGRDIFGKPTAITRHNPSGSVTETRSYVYDSYQLLCKTIEPETGATLVEYDGANNVAWSAPGQTLTGSTCDRGSVAAADQIVRTYDARNRLKTLTVSDGRGNQSWTYTPDGLPETITTSNGFNGNIPVVNAYHYNHRRMLDGDGETVTEPNFFTWGIGYGWDANGHQSIQTYPSGLSVDFAPNALGQPKQAGSYATGVTYYPNGAIKHFVYGNGILHDMTQNARQLPDTSTDAYGTSKFLSDSYDYDPNGNVAAITDGATGTGQRGNRTMSYDALDRLMAATSPMFGNGATGTASFTYDALDNLTKLVMPATATTAARTQYYCYDSTTRRLASLRSAANCGGTVQTSLTYDARGNIATKGGMTFDFDLTNRLKSIDNGGVVENYRYDGYGLRALKNAASGNLWSQYTHDGRLLQEVNARTGIQTEYVYLGGSLVAERETPTTGGTAVVKYQHTDALGTPVAVTSASRTVLVRNEYEPYGQLLNHTVTDAVGYTGHVQDGLTGLTYMQQRYYDPMIGRFLSVDPVTAYSNPVGAFNRYDYAANNPYRFTDPDGRQETENKIKSQIPNNRDSLTKHTSNNMTAPSRTLSGGEKSVSTGQSTNSPSQGQSSIKSWLCNTGNLLADASDKAGEASGDLELLGLGVSTAGTLTGQPEIVGGGFTLAEVGGIGSVGSGVLQFNAGLLQGLGGGGYDNAKNAAFSLATGLTLARFIKGPATTGYRTVSQRASDRFLNRSSIIVGGVFDVLPSLVNQLAPQQVPCP